MRRSIITNSYVSNHKDADDDLEAPVNDAFSCQDDHHEEYYETDEDQEFFLQMLEQLPNMIDSWISRFEVTSSIHRKLLHLSLIMQQSIHLILHENNNY